MKRLLTNALFAALVAASGLAVQSGIAFGAASDQSLNVKLTHFLDDLKTDRHGLKRRDLDDCKRTHSPRITGPESCDDR